MKALNKDLTSFNDLLDEKYGPLGTERRTQIEEKYTEWCIGEIVQEAREGQGLTQEQLAQKVGTSKSYISKIENNVKEAKLSTLRKIVEQGLGMHLTITITP